MGFAFLALGQGVAVFDVRKRTFQIPIQILYGKGRKSTVCPVPVLEGVRALLAA